MVLAKQFRKKRGTSPAKSPSLFSPATTQQLGGGRTEERAPRTVQPRSQESTLRKIRVEYPQTVAQSYPVSYEETLEMRDPVPNVEQRVDDVMSFMITSPKEAEPTAAMERRNSRPLNTYVDPATIPPVVEVHVAPYEARLDDLPTRLILRYSVRSEAG